MVSSQESCSFSSCHEIRGESTPAQLFRKSLDNQRAWCTFLRSDIWGWNFMIIDMHNHCVAPTALDRILMEPESHGFSENLQPRERERLSWWRQFTDLENRKAGLQEMGADGAVLSSSPGLSDYTLPLHQAQRLCETLNDGLSEWVRGKPAFRGMAAVPLQDGPKAAEDLRRAKEDLHLAGAMLVTHIGEWNLDAPEIEPFWEAAEALDVPIFIHPDPTRVAARNRLACYGLQTIIGVPMETTIAAATLVLSGVFDRHPKLKVVLSHGGGYLPIAFGRLTHAYRFNEETRASAALPPEAYLKRFYYDTVLFHPEPLCNLIRLVGADRVLLGTDYPFNAEFPDTVRFIEALGLAAEESRAILGGAAKLYGFE
jgi:aminocarboxymuconate-semialdehyde decarboxylase